MRTYLRGKITLLFMTCAVLLAIPAIALADIVANNIDTTVDTVAEQMPLQAGGPNGTTKLYVINTNTNLNQEFPDSAGNNSCNLAGDTTNLQVDVTSSNPAVATVSPASATINDCGEANGVTLTVSPLTAGSTTVTVARKAGTTNTAPGNFAFAPATFTVNVTPPPNTPPQVSVQGVTGGANYNKDSVPNATCQVTDTEDGNKTFAATLSAITGPYASDGIGSQTASCSYTDNGPGPGLTASSSVIYNIVDPTPPVINKVVTGTLGNNGWYKSDVTLKWTVTENESPNSLQLTGCEDQSITADQAEQTYSCSATSAGGSSGPQSVAIKRDATAPTDIAFVGGGLTDGASYYFGSVPAGPTSCTADGAISGLKSPNGCVLSGYSTAVGNQAVTATAEDNAGNIATKTLSYTVKAWTLSGFYNPVDYGTNVWNTVKGGSTVPLKFEVFAGSTELTDPSVVEKFTATPVTCPNGSVTTDAIEILSTGGTTLRYDGTAGQFIQNWQTPKKPGACYAVTMTTDDGTSLPVAHFQLK